MVLADKTKKKIAIAISTCLLFSSEKLPSDRWINMSQISIKNENESASKRSAIGKIFEESKQLIGSDYGIKDLDERKRKVNEIIKKLDPVLKSSEGVYLLYNYAVEKTRPDMKEKDKHIVAATIGLIIRMYKNNVMFYIDIQRVIENGLYSDNLSKFEVSCDLLHSMYTRFPPTGGFLSASFNINYDLIFNRILGIIDKDEKKREIFNKYFKFEDASKDLNYIPKR